MARRKTPARRNRRQESSSSGLLWMLFGLAIGLSVAAAIYVNDRQPETDSPPVPVPQQPVTAPAPQPAAPAAESQPEDPSSRFDFYDMLPNFEVVIPEEDLDARPDVKPAPVESPGVYVLQAGSFSSFGDADRMKAQLALLGIVSRIQKVTVDDNTYHRVRIGPVQTLEELNRLRAQLRDARVEVMVIRVGN